MYLSVRGHTSLHMCAEATKDVMSDVAVSFLDQASRIERVSQDVMDTLTVVGISTATRT
jgi:hypothetical protein